jgi:hypothetical protein
VLTFDKVLTPRKAEQCTSAQQVKPSSSPVKPSNRGHQSSPVWLHTSIEAIDGILPAQSCSAKSTRFAISLLFLLHPVNPMYMSPRPHPLPFFPHILLSLHLASSISCLTDLLNIIQVHCMTTASTYNFSANNVHGWFGERLYCSSSHLGHA